MPLVSPLTIDDFERLPDALALNHELVDGKLVEVSGKTPIHNRLRDYLNRLLGDYVMKNGLCEFISEQEYDFGGNAYGPEVSFYVTEKMPLLEERRRVQPFLPELKPPDRPTRTMMTNSPARPRPASFRLDFTRRS
jgi:Uma2 family endonuclease